MVNYTLARKGARVTGERSRLRLSLPGDLPLTALTVHLTGIAAETKVQPPPGGLVYRKGDQVWLTTPPLGSVPPDVAPGLQRVYQGPVGAIRLERPHRIAGVRVLQMGKPQPGFRLAVDLLTDLGRTALFGQEPGENWGSWHLFPTVPEKPAPMASGVEVSADPCLKQMEVWALAGSEK
ncbi:MAG: hypothetical protein K0Q72_958 [Armatimonadetes bacterium]|nr:hypothetical protein [Armatimonadota bacterium]